MSEVTLQADAAQTPDGEVRTLTIEKWKQNSNWVRVQDRTSSFCQFCLMKQKICEQAKCNNLAWIA
jgi:hypothetical protein